MKSVHTFGYSTVHYHGTFEKIFKVLGKDADMETLCMDSTSIKAHPQSAGAKKGH